MLQQNFSSIAAITTVATFVAAAPAFSQNFNGKKITGISIKYIGAKTVDEQRIINQMSSAVGSVYNGDKLDNDIRTLYKSGFIDSVNIKGSSAGGGVRLTAEVATSPFLANVGFEGNQKFQNKTLSRKSKLTAGKIIGAPDITSAKKFIKEHYASYDFPDVTITTRLQKTAKPGHADLIFTINEGGKNEISKIEFQGNNAFDYNTLKKEIKSRKKGIFSFITKSGTIDNNQVAEDVEKIIDYYKDNGYLKAYSPGHQFIPVKNGKVKLVIPIVEGAKYTVSDVRLSKMTQFTPEQLLPTFVLDPGDPYSQSQMREDIKTIRAYYGSKGYAQVRVRPKLTNSASNKINILYEIEEGSPSKVGRINITGNSITKDRVIRREVTLQPGEPFNSVEVDTIKSRLRSLNYFDPSTLFVQDKQSTQPGYRDLDIQVQEQKTGSLSFGAGVSSIDSIVGFVGLEQRNFDITNFRTFRGGGQRLNINIRGGAETTDASISLIEPWIFGKKLEAGVEAYYRDLLFLSDEYDLTKVGGAIHLRKAIGPKSSIKGELRWERNEVELEDDLDPASEFNQFGGDFDRTAFTLSYIYDSRNAITTPRRGHKVDIGLTYSFGDAENYTLEASGAKHWNFKHDIIWTLEGEVATTDSTNDDVIPIFDRHFLGGARNLRGFEFNDIGTRDPVTGEVFGGATRAYVTSEFTIPIVDNVRGAVFADAGTVSDESWDLGSGLYLDAGVGLRLNLPIGPLALDYAFPLKSPDEDSDNGGQFNFYLDYNF